MIKLYMEQIKITMFKKMHKILLLVFYDIVFILEANSVTYFHMFDGSQRRNHAWSYLDPCAHEKK